MKTVSLKIADSVDAQMAAEAKRVGLSKSALIREAIEERLKRSSTEAAGSFLDRALDLAGCVDGPEDLSCNESHLEQYGS